MTDISAWTPFLLQVDEKAPAETIIRDAAEWLISTAELPNPESLDGITEADFDTAGLPEKLVVKAFLKRTLRSVNDNVAAKRAKTAGGSQGGNSNPPTASPNSKEAAVLAKLLGGDISAGGLALALATDVPDVTGASQVRDSMTCLIIFKQTLRCGRRWKPRIEQHRRFTHRGLHSPTSISRQKKFFHFGFHRNTSEARSTGQGKQTVSSKEGQQRRR